MISYLARGGSYLGVAFFFSTGSAGIEQIAFAFLLIAVFDMCCSPMVGAIFDKLSFSVSVILPDLARGLTFLLVPIFVGDVNKWLVFSIFIVFERFARLSLSRLIINSIPLDARFKANAKIGILQEVGLCIGALAAGAVTSFYGTANYFFFVGGLYILATFFVSCWLSRNVGGENKIAEGQEKASVPHLRVKKPLTIILSRNSLNIAILNLILDVTNSVVPFLMINELQKTAADYGLIDSSWAAGSLVCGFLIARLSVKDNLIGATAIFCVILICLGVLFFINKFQLMVVFMLVAGGFFNLALLKVEFSFQGNVNKSEIGRERGYISFFSGIINSCYFFVLVISNFFTAKSAFFLALLVCLILLSFIKFFNAPNEHREHGGTEAKIPKDIVL
ncbi:hypothetical protein C4J91_2432 [Pseudomonas sp. R3-52-08]|nr:hypothetical protein C4J91_2432 [Pseudomonas sp. R3-52-08]